MSPVGPEESGEEASRIGRALLDLSARLPDGFVDSAGERVQADLYVGYTAGGRVWEVEFCALDPARNFWMSGPDLADLLDRALTRGREYVREERTAAASRGGDWLNDLGSGSPSEEEDEELSATKGRGIRPATEKDLAWLRNGPDPAELERQRREEVERASSASTTPAHWKSTAPEE